MKEKEDNCVVYIGRLEGKIVYIGEGKVGRELHLNSGVSHLYQANEAHFNGNTIDVEIYANNISKHKAKDLEKVLIQEHNPAWNTTFTRKSAIRLVIRKLLVNVDTRKSARLSILKAGVNSIDSDGVFTFSSSDVHKMCDSFHGLYKSFGVRKTEDKMFEYLDLVSRPMYKAKLNDAWLAQLEIQILELKRKL